MKFNYSLNKLKVQLFHGLFRNCALLLRDIGYHCTSQRKRRDTCYVCTKTETRGGLHDKVYALQRVRGEVHNIFYVLQLQREGEGKFYERNCSNISCNKYLL